jgi:deoxyribonuclease V
VDPPTSALEVWWPEEPGALIDLQDRLSAVRSDPWSGAGPAVGGCFVCFGRGGSGPGSPGDRGWAGAAVLGEGTNDAEAALVGTAPAAYLPGMLALREGRLLQAVVEALPMRPDVLLVNATGREHPRRAGLAVHLGAVLGVPTVGVTHRPLIAEGSWPPDRAGANAPLTIGADEVGRWVRTRPGARPVAAHAAWRTDPQTAARVVSESATAARTPEPIRVARRLARTLRAAETYSPR